MREQTARTPGRVSGSSPCPLAAGALFGDPAYEPPFEARATSRLNAGVAVVPGPADPRLAFLAALLRALAPHLQGPGHGSVPWPGLLEKATQIVDVPNFHPADQALYEAWGDWKTGVTPG